MADDRPGFIALPRAIFASPAWKEKRQFSTFEALVDLAGLASFSARKYDYKGTVVHLAARETPPLSVRFLMQRWGWKSTATVSRFVAGLLETGGLVQNSKRNTEQNTIPNTYFVGRCILATLGETPNETSSRTPVGTKKKKEEEQGLKETPLPTGEDAVASGVERDGLVMPEMNGKGMTANVLIGAWLKWRESVSLPRPSPAEISKQGAFAARICRDHEAEHIIAAFAGIQTLTPHGPPFNQPWDLGTLREKFTRARDNVANHPAVQAARERANLDEMLEGL